jgi:hypothetical protein
LFFRRGSGLDALSASFKEGAETEKKIKESLTFPDMVMNINVTSTPRKHRQDGYNDLSSIS